MAGKTITRRRAPAGGLQPHILCLYYHPVARSRSPEFLTQRCVRTLQVGYVDLE